MENNQNQEIDKTVEVSEVKKDIFNDVTSFSKILAAVLFITLPFVGFYLGFTINVSDNNQISNSEYITTDTSKEEVEVVQNPSTDTHVFPYYVEEDLEKLKTNLNKNEKDLSLVKQFTAEFENETLSEFVLATSTEASLLRLVDNDQYSIYTKLGIEGGKYLRLFKHDKKSNMLSEMKTSDYFHDGYNHSIFSADKKYIATITEEGTELALIDVTTDTIKSIMKIEPAEAKRFTNNCEFTCEANLKWIDSESISVKVFNYDFCEYDDSRNNWVCEPSASPATQDVIVEIKN